jgi:hypothetical protein
MDVRGLRIAFVDLKRFLKKKLLFPGKDVNIFLVIR